MPRHRESIGDQSLLMMKQVLTEECARRGISSDGTQGQDLSRVLMHAFRSGMTEKKELVVLVRNLTDLLR